MIRSVIIISLILLSGKIAASEFHVHVPMSDKGLATYYVPGKIGGYGETEFMVDTGSGYATINSATLRILKKEGKARYVKDLVGTMADGAERIYPVYQIEQITIGKHCSINNVEVAVLPGKTRNILGMNVLKRAAPFAIMVSPAQLRLSQCDNEIDALAKL